MARWNFMPPESISSSFSWPWLGWLWVATVIGIEGYPPPNATPQKKIKALLFRDYEGNHHHPLFVKALLNVLRAPSFFFGGGGRHWGGTLRFPWVCWNFAPFCRVQRPISKLCEDKKGLTDDSLLDSSSPGMLQVWHHGFSAVGWRSCDWKKTWEQLKKKTAGYFPDTFHEILVV